MTKKKEVLKPLLMRTGRTPFQVFLLIGCVISSPLGLINENLGSASIRVALDSRTWIWYVLLLSSALLSLYGTFSSKLPLNLFLERVGMIWVGTLFFVYGLGIVLVSNPGRVTTAIVMTCLSAAAFARAVQITVDLRDLKKAVTAPLREVHQDVLAQPLKAGETDD